MDKTNPAIWIGKHRRRHDNGGVGRLASASTWETAYGQQRLRQRILTVIAGIMDMSVR